jgi:hypothetical protein
MEKKVTIEGPLGCLTMLVLYIVSGAAVIGAFGLLIRAIRWTF